MPLRSPNHMHFLFPPTCSYNQRRSVMWCQASFYSSVQEIFALLRHYAAQIGNNLPTFRYNLSVPDSWRWDLIGCIETSVTTILQSATTQNSEDLRRNVVHLPYFATCALTTEWCHHRFKERQVPWYVTRYINMLNDKLTCFKNFVNIYRGADESLARPGRKQATAIEDFEFHISYL